MKEQSHPLRKQFRLSDHELLRELLKILRVRGNLDKISTLALNEFGSLRQALAQNSEDLKRIKEFTPNVIRKLKTIYSLHKEIIKPMDYPSSSQKFEGLAYYLHTSPKWDGECLRLLLLDQDHFILRDYIYKKGSGCTVKFYLREIVKEVLRFGISKLVMIHHKMTSSSNPTSLDRERYKEFQIGFQALDITLVDYLIIGEASLFSFNDNKLHF